MKVIDLHTHLELNLPGIPQDNRRNKPPRLFMYLYEMMGYRSPFWGKGNYPEPVRMLISLDNQLRLSMASVDKLLACMDRSGVTVSVAMPIAPYITASDYLARIESIPRILTFSTVHPQDRSWEDTLRRDMERGCRGVKIHPIAQGLDPEGEFYFHLFEELEQYGKPVLAHTGEFEYFIPKSPYSVYGQIPRFEKLIASFPRVPVILGHMGLFDAQVAIELARRYENVYLETSFQSVAVVRRAIKEVGRHRVIFGSDWPESEQWMPLRIARRAAGKDRDLAERLLWKNAQQLIGPVGI